MQNRMMLHNMHTTCCIACSRMPLLERTAAQDAGIRRRNILLTHVTFICAHMGMLEHAHGGGVFVGGVFVKAVLPSCKTA
jgi:hypothetical protein